MMMRVLLRCCCCKWLSSLSHFVDWMMSIRLDSVAVDCIVDCGGGLLLWVVLAVVDVEVVFGMMFFAVVVAVVEVAEVGVDLLSSHRTYSHVVEQ